ncbi:MAG: hypothetical protein WBG50_07930 [Desulfomonilaceae bacterium]
MSDQERKTRKKRPRDLNLLAKSILEEAIAENTASPEEEQDTKNPNAVALGRLGGLKGGKARAKRLTPEERSEIARIAAQARWKKSDR